MLLMQLINSPIAFLVYIISLVIALTIHEAAHAYSAYLAGDNTPKMMGRLTLNPLAHLDLWGSIFMLIAGFGWGKPVIVNPKNFTNPKMDYITTSLAGPVSNFLLAAILGLGLRFLPLNDLWQIIFSIVIFFNLALMIFNLLPIPPLDGSKVWSLVMSERNFAIFQQFGIMILFFLILFEKQFPLLSFISTRVVGFFFKLLSGQEFPL